MRIYFGSGEIKRHLRYILGNYVIMQKFQRPRYVNGPLKRDRILIALNNGSVQSYSSLTHVGLKEFYVFVRRL